MSFPRNNHELTRAIGREHSIFPLKVTPDDVYNSPRV